MAVEATFGQNRQHILGEVERGSNIHRRWLGLLARNLPATCDREGAKTRSDSQPNRYAPREAEVPRFASP